MCYSTSSSNLPSSRRQSSEDENGLKQIQTVKKIAAYHQYYAVNKAVESTKRATAAAHCAREDPVSYGNLPTVKDQPEGDQKAGVVWHTQGSGKSLSMVFYTGKIVLELNNPTIVVLTDQTTSTSNSLIPLLPVSSF